VRRFGLLLVAALGLAACRDRDPVVAKVGPLAIKQSEFQRKLGDVAQGYQNYVITPNGRRQFLDILIREKMLLAAASASETRRSPEYKEQLARMRTEEEERLREGRDYLLTQMWLEDLRSKGVLKVNDDEARDYWKRHPVAVEVRHVLLATPADAEQVAKKARNGANFALLAKQLSLDASTARDGGRMPATLYGEIIPDLEDIVFRMRPGEVGGPIKTKFGYHVIRKEGEKKLDFDKVKDRIVQLLEKQKLDKYLQSVQEKFPVEVVDEQFK
jgi:peptidyl-prolyl cis-trans isomerase C